MEGGGRSQRGSGEAAKDTLAGYSKASASRSERDGKLPEGSGQTSDMI